MEKLFWLALSIYFITIGILFCIVLAIKWQRGERLPRAEINRWLLNIALFLYLGWQLYANSAEWISSTCKYLVYLSSPIIIYDMVIFYKLFRNKNKNT